MRMIALAAIVTALALAVVGCGSSKTASSTSQSSASRQPSAGNQQAFTRLRQCLEAHGVKPPSGPPQGRQQGQPPSFDANTQAAMQACRQYLPARPQGQAGFGG
jgi:hypothetical protein